MIKCRECGKALEHFPSEGVCNDCHSKIITQGMNQIIIAIFGLLTALFLSPRTHDTGFIPVLENAASFFASFCLGSFVFALLYAFVLPYLSKKLFFLSAKEEAFIFVGFVAVVSILWAVL